MTTQHQQWEYKEESTGSRTPDYHFMQEQANNGWEFVWHYIDPTYGSCYIFKRPKQ